MSFAFVNVASDFNNDPIPSVSLAVTEGNLLVAYVDGSGVQGVLIVSDGRNVWVPIEPNLVAGYGAITAYYTIARKTETLTIKAFNSADSGTSATGTVQAYIIALEISGLAASPIDQEASTYSNVGAGSFSVGPVTTTVASEILIGTLFLTAGGMVAGSGYTIPTNGTTSVSATEFGIEYQIVASTGSYSATATGNLSNWMMSLGTLKAASAASHKHFLPLLGVGA